jgi:hypothetical protein
MLGIGTILALVGMSQVIDTASSPANTSCANAPTLHAQPSVHSGPQELSGGIYNVGGPAPGSRVCAQASPLAGKVTVSSASRKKVVATKVVAAGQQFAIQLPAGRYSIEYGVKDGECPHAGPVVFTQPRQRTVHLDLLCELK